jgi:hypothetical protein
VQTVFVVSIAAGTLIAPPLVSSLGIRGALLATGALLPALGLVLFKHVRRLDAGAGVDPAHVELLGSVPIFAPLPESALEHLAGSLTPVDLPAGWVVFTQGDDGDGFYVVQSGRVDVEIDGAYVRTLGAGASFGEIALLRDVPRTATIRTRDEVRLLRLERAPFLATVTGDPASAHAADNFVGGLLGLRSGFSAS